MRQRLRRGLVWKIPLIVCSSALPLVAVAPARSEFSCADCDKEQRFIRRKIDRPLARRGYLPWNASIKKILLLLKANTLRYGVFIGIKRGIEEAGSSAERSPQSEIRRDRRRRTS